MSHGKRGIAENNFSEGNRQSFGDCELVCGVVAFGLLN
jgi:hypothetical protein